MDKKEKEQVALREITLLDKIFLTIRKKLGYREGTEFILDVEPKLKNYSEIELMRLATIEEKLKRVLQSNEEGLIDGIEESEAKALLEWTAQNARVAFAKELDTKEILEKSLLGYCGLGQGVTGTTLLNMGLKPNIVNAGETLSKGGWRHSFLTVRIPIKKDGKIEDKMYLVDTTFRQFFLRTEIRGEGGFIKDKRYGNKVAGVPGYWMLQLPNGEKVARELLSEGFIEFTEENAKIYGDAFELANRKRKSPSKVPKKKELITGIAGSSYIENTEDVSLQQEIDYNEGELENVWGINVKTPLMVKEKGLEQAPKVEANKTHTIEDEQLEI